MTSTTRIDTRRYKLIDTRTGRDVADQYDLSWDDAVTRSYSFQRFAVAVVQDHSASDWHTQAEES